MVKLDNDCIIITPDGDFTIYAVEVAYKEILALLDSAKKIKLELQSCQKIDSASLQLLLALHKEAELSGRGWVVENACYDIGQFIAFYNVNEILKASI